MLGVALPDRHNVCLQPHSTPSRSATDPLTLDVLDVREDFLVVLLLPRLCWWCCSRCTQALSGRCLSKEDGSSRSCRQGPGKASSFVHVVDKKDAAQQGACDEQRNSV